MTKQKITFLVGTDKKLDDVVTEADVMPLLRSAVRAGAREALIADGDGKTLWAHRDAARSGLGTSSLPLSLEGEPVGSVVVRGDKGTEDRLRGVAGLLCDALTSVLTSSLKRMLSAEMHTNVVNLSYDELIEANAKLHASEAKYRELAETLEKKVAERTDELKRAHAKLLQQEKMASIGQLAAGAAHEINNPLGFILSNLHTMRKYQSRMREMLMFHQSSLNRSGVPEDTRRAAQEKWRDFKIDFILADVEQLISQSVSGADRLRKIVSDLKGFSHIDDTAESPADINAEIDKTLNVLGHYISGSAKILRDYGPLPLFVCNPAILCQVFLNIILNALQARKDGLELMISTRHANDVISIRFTDNGPGVPENIRERIFEPFFTTKDVGKGTGMGLTVAYDIVTVYGGTVKLDETPPGTGASFHITLPAKGGRNVKVLRPV